MDRALVERKFMERALRRHTMSRKLAPAASNGVGFSGTSNGNKLRSESLRAVVLADDSTVRWSEQDIPDDTGCVRATFPVPRDGTHFCFEATIVHGDDITLGLATFDSEGKRLVDSSYAYSGKSGQVKAMGTTRKYAPLKSGDVVTCGTSFFGHSVEPFVFFALNGELLEPYLPWRGHKNSDVHPFVSSTFPSAVVKLTFDEAMQVKWGGVLREVERERERKRLEKIKENVDLESVCERIVRDFLLHHGYVDTLRAMDGTVEEVHGNGNKNDSDEKMEIESQLMHGYEASGNSQTRKSKSGVREGNEEEDEAMMKRNGNSDMLGGKHSQQRDVKKKLTTTRKRGVEVLSFGPDTLELAKERRKVRTLVLEGRPVEAMRVVEERWPDVLSSSPVGLDLRVQCLVELIMARQYRDAIALARAELWPYIKAHLDQADAKDDGAEQVAESAEASLVKRALGMFALADLTSEAAQAKLSLLDRKRVVADSLNRVLLFHPNPPKSPAIERILTRLNEFHSAAKDKAGGYGAASEQDDI